jgi:hypothetical protein
VQAQPAEATEQVDAPGAGGDGGPGGVEVDAHEAVAERLGGAAAVDGGEGDLGAVLAASGGVDVGDDEIGGAELAGGADALAGGAGGDVEEAAVDAPALGEGVASGEAEAGVGPGVEILPSEKGLGSRLPHEAIGDEGHRRGTVLEPPEERLGADGEATGLGRRR